MRRLPTAIYTLAAITTFAAPAFAHHSQAMFDTTKEILVEGTVARFDWVNPHMYMVVNTKGPDGQAGAGRRRRPRDHAGAGRRPRSRRAQARHAGRHARQSQSRRLGQAGSHPRRHDPGRRDSPVLCGQHSDAHADAGREPRGSLGAHRAALGAAFGAMARWPVTPEGRAAQTKLVADGLCYVEPIPFLAVLDELRTIEIGKDEVVMRFDNTGDHVDRIVHMTAAASGRRSTLAPRALHRPVGRRDARDRHDRASSPTRPASA